jgi:hypothetical protein
VVVFIFRGIVHRKVVDKLWLMDFSRHRFNVITVAGSTILVSVCFDLYPELRLGRGGGRGRAAQRARDGRGGRGGGGGRGTLAVGAPPMATPPATT